MKFFNQTEIKENLISYNFGISKKFHGIDISKVTAVFTVNAVVVIFEKIGKLFKRL